MDERNEFRNTGALEVEKTSAETVGALERVPVQNEYLIGQQNSRACSDAGGYSHLSYRDRRTRKTRGKPENGHADFLVACPASV